MLVTTDSYDCSPASAHEPVHRHIYRVVHNWIHPQHRIHFIAPVALSCHIPAMAVVTVTAPSDLPPIDDEPTGAYPTGHGFGGYGDYGRLAMLEGVYGGHTPHASVPEPNGLAMLVPLVAVLAWRMRRGRVG